MKLFSTLVLFLFLLGGCGKSEFEMAVEAYEADDYKTAIEIFSTLAKSGHAQAQYRLAYMYERELGVEKNIDEAAKWYLKAAKQGDVQSQVKVAGLYLRGIGFKKDIWEAMKWSRKAAVQGNPEAEANIGYMFHDGIGVKQDYLEASKWYRKAAEQGLASAQHDLGVMYQNGRGVRKNYPLAIEWYRKAANQGFIRSQDNLNGMYEKQLGIPSGKEDEIFRWFLDLAQKKDITAQYHLGHLYQLGKGVEKNEIRAYAWSGIASAGGFESAQVLRNQIESTLKQNQLEEARAYARELWDKYGNKPEEE